MAKVTIEFDTDIPEQYNNAVEILTGILGERPTTEMCTPSACADAPPAPEQLTPTLNTPVVAGNPFADVPTPPIPPVPVADTPVEPPMPPVPPTTSAVELDSEGLPWDARIHTDAKTRRQRDNTWKLKRKVDDVLVKQVKAELKGRANTIDQAKLDMAGDEAPPALTTSTAPGYTAAPTLPPTPPTAMTYAALMPLITSGTREGTLAIADVTAACDAIGIDTAADLVDRPELIPAFAAQLGLSC